MSVLGIVILAGTGLLTGSFLNLVSDRLYRKKDFVSGRSYCEFCKHTLSSWDLIPVFSFLFLNGKCRYCRKKLSLLYPISELLTAAIFVFAYFLISYRNLEIIYLPYFLIGFSLFIVIFLSDYKYYEIPFNTVIFGVIFSFIYRVLFLQNLTSENYIYELASILGIGLFFYLIIFLSRGGMGGGDFKLSFFISIFLGFPKNVYAIYYSFVIGGIFALILLVGGKKGLKAKIPFGPFMIIGTLLSLLI